MQPDKDIEHIYLDDEEPASTPAHPHHHTEPPIENKAEYRKFAYVLLGILTLSTVLSLVRGWEPTRAMADFMAVFFITFSAFKFADIELFAHTYRTYDILAQRIRPWGYIYPFIEAFLGFWYLLSEAPNNLNVITLLVTGTAAFGVWKEVSKKHHSKFMCACLGRYIRLPLSKVSLVEDVAMFVMAAVMLFMK
jgi:hypothetical protein